MSIIDLDPHGYVDDNDDNGRAPATEPNRVRVVVEVMVIVLIAVTAIVVWPAPLGGDTSFVIVHGTSMHPALDSGDIVVTRSAGHYSVGDIVAYRIPAGQAAAGHVIIHRIVAVTPRGFEMRGDNRTSADAWYPSTRDVMGRVMLHLPVPAGEGFWRALPWLFGALIGTGIVWLLWTRPNEDEDGEDDEDEGSVDLQSGDEPDLDGEDEPASVIERWSPPATERVQMELPPMSSEDLDNALRMVLESLSVR